MDLNKMEKKLGDGVLKCNGRKTKQCEKSHVWVININNLLHCEKLNARKVKGERGREEKLCKKNNMFMREFNYERVG